MGRPREHDDRTRTALRAAAEGFFDEEGSDDVTVRVLADEVGTTTRAVYSLFGSREGLLFDALGTRAYDWLTAAVDAHPETDDVVADLVDMATSVFRRFVREQPLLYRITFQRVVPNFAPGPELVTARATAIEHLTAKLRRLDDAGLLRTKTVRQAVIEFQALCEGLANFEMRGNVLPMLADNEHEAWTEAFTTLLQGMTAKPPRRRK